MRPSPPKGFIFANDALHKIMTSLSRSQKFTGIQKDMEAELRLRGMCNRGGVFAWKPGNEPPVQIASDLPPLFGRFRMTFFDPDTGIISVDEGVEDFLKNPPDEIVPLYGNSTVAAVFAHAREFNGYYAVLKLTDPKIERPNKSVTKKGNIKSKSSKQGRPVKYDPEVFVGALREDYGAGAEVSVQQAYGSWKSRGLPIPSHDTTRKFRRMLRDK